MSIRGLIFFIFNINFSLGKLKKTKPKKNKKNSREKL